MLRRRPQWLCLVIFAALLPAVDGALAQQAPRRIQFARGRSSAEVRGSVVRGERHQYLIGAKAGQVMTVHITALERNAVFTLLSPGDRKALPGTEESKDARRWTGRLPKSGDYLISVGGTRGNATYTLHVAIRARAGRKRTGDLVRRGGVRGARGAHRLATSFLLLLEDRHDLVVAAVPRDRVSTGPFLWGNRAGNG